MIVAFPVGTNDGIQSRLHDHFGRAEFFLIIDSESKDIYEVVENKKSADQNASCKSDRFSSKHHVEAVVTKCIGNGSLKNLNKQHIKVFQAMSDHVEDNLDLMKSDRLRLFHMFDICQGQKNKKQHAGCGHH